MATHASPEITEIRNIPMPVKTKKPGRGSRSAYPFDALEVGQSFGVKNKAKKNLASIISNQHKRHAVQVIDEATGKPIKKTIDVPQKDGSVTKMESEHFLTKPGRTFVAYDVDPATDPDGASCRVYRTA